MGQRIWVVCVCGLLFLVPSKSAQEWEQVVSGGFGYAGVRGAGSVFIFDGMLYVGTTSSVGGCQVWRSEDGGTWSQVNSDGFGETTTTSAPSMAEFDGQLYVGTRNTSLGGAVWRSPDGLTWTQAAGGGFNFPDNWEVSSLIVFQDVLYAGTMNRNTGCQVWRTTDGTAWLRGNYAGYGEIENDYVASLAVFDGHLYVGTHNQDTGCELWRTGNGVSWHQVNVDGFGSAANSSLDSMAAFDGYLYAGTENTALGGEIWRSADGTTWELVASGGMDLFSNVSIVSLAPVDGALLAGTFNSQLGCELWRTRSGVEWESFVAGGFGAVSNRSAETIKVFDRGLYVGTLNFASGCEVWRLPLCAARRSLPSCYAPGRATHVVVETTLPDSAQSYTVEDSAPSGWTVSSVSHDGLLTGQTVTWGPFGDGQPRTLSYAATPPDGTVGVQTFSGTITIDGQVQPSCGDEELDDDCDQSDYHPADLGDNWRTEVDEVTAYGAAWSNGVPWERPPNPIPVDYVTNAGLIWIEGEIYHYVPTQEPPWLPGYGKVMIRGGTAVATIVPASYIPGEAVEVGLEVTPAADTANYAVEDRPPSGWAVSAISGDGQLDLVNGLVKWGPFFDDEVRQLSYAVTPPAGESGPRTFAGVASFDGVSVAITGDRTIDWGGGPQPCTPGATVMCLNDNRFQVEVGWRDFGDETGAGQVAPAGSADSGLFWFFDQDNWEMLVKVLDGCGVNGHYWVFAAATTNVEYTLTVLDTETGEEATYLNPLGVSSPAITDTEALATCP